MKIEKLTTGPKQHLFGFHDICAWNSNNDRLVAIEVDDITTPPNPAIEFGLGYVSEDKIFHRFGYTHAFNYPQGARQQWLYNTNNVIVNDIKNGNVFSKIYDTDTQKEIETCEASTHVITDDGWAFGLNYARLFRLGAYGYAGTVDHTANERTPVKDGIIKHNIFSKEKLLLVSTKQLSEFEMNPQLGLHHYLTHLVLSPDQKRIAFLHRYKLKDGGETTRLCTIGTDGSELRCLVTGFLSHFDWMDNEHVMIWGRTGSGIEKFRSSLMYRIIPNSLLQQAKKTIKKFRSKNQPSATTESPFHWLSVQDKNEPSINFVANGVITEDGHPMYCPTNRNWFVCDNYPDNHDGIRTLFLYSLKDDKKIDLGKFKMINDKPNIKESIAILKGTDESILKAVGLESFIFTRSGLHCDLHPRWSPNGKMVAFDSIHEGDRQIYMIDVNDILNGKEK